MMNCGHLHCFAVIPLICPILVQYVTYFYYVMVSVRFVVFQSRSEVIVVICSVQADLGGGEM